MNIAIVGDVHGHLALMYAVLGRWQREAGRRIDLILQCGDMGAFAATSRLDQATRRWSENDPEELGFAEFAGPSPPATLMEARPPLVFIPGNHEDFEFLDECERRAPASDAIYSVSQDGWIHALRSGHIWTFINGEQRLRVAGLSGIANRAHKKGMHPRYHLVEEEALRLAQAGPGKIDILISHEAPDALFGEDYRGMAGSSALRFVIEDTLPRLAFFAHYDRVGEWKIGPTEVYGMGKCGYIPSGIWPVAEDGLAIVGWTEDEVTVERLRDEWLGETTRSNWKHWGRR